MSNIVEERELSVKLNFYFFGFPKKSLSERANVKVTLKEIESTFNFLSLPIFSVCPFLFSNILLSFLHDFCFPNFLQSLLLHLLSVCQKLFHFSFYLLNLLTFLNLILAISCRNSINPKQNYTA